MEEEPIFCPACGEETEHAPVKAGRKSLVQCAECGNVHPLERPRERLASLKVIMNRDGLAQPYCVNLPAEEVLKVGEEILVDDGKSDVALARITSLEAERRLNRAPAKDVRTVWAMAVDEVPLKIAVYHRGKTLSLKKTVPGEEIVEIGEIRDAEGVRFKVTKIKLRGEGFADSAPAKNITRVWGREL